jgi:hypothetical protein
MLNALPQSWRDFLTSFYNTLPDFERFTPLEVRKRTNSCGGISQKDLSAHSTL